MDMVTDCNNGGGGVGSVFSEVDDEATRRNLLHMNKVCVVHELRYRR
jgi:hypothetical protein